MCPACIASAALLAGSVMTTGGLTTLVLKIFCPQKSETTFGLKNPTQRRNDHGYGNEQDGTSENRAAS
jgi:hypothetical protein